MKASIENAKNKHVLNKIENSNIPWDWYGLSMNPIITWEIVRAHPDKHWDWYWLSQNPNITWDIVRANPDKPWSWYGLTKNPNITWDIVRANLEKPWSWFWLSQNSSFLLSGTEQKQIIVMCCREHQAAKRIQKAWRRAISDPCFRLCKIRLKREFHDLQHI